MTLTKKDILKLTTFYNNLDKYLRDWTSKNFFYYHSLHEKNLCQEIAIERDTLQEANSYYQNLDQDDRDKIKMMLRANLLSFRASNSTPLYFVKFDYIKKC